MSHGCWPCCRLTMSVCEFRIARLPPRRLWLVKVHGKEGGPLSSPSAAPGIGGVCHRASVQGPRAFRIGASEWLLLDYSRTGALRCALNGGDRMLANLFDVSSAFVSMRVEGARACQVLTMESDATGIGHCVEPEEYTWARNGNAVSILQCVHRYGFELHVDRSAADDWTSRLIARKDTALRIQ